MQTYKPFFAWWVITCLVGTLIYWLSTIGAPMLIYKIDVTHVTQGIAAVAFVANLWIGFLAWRVARNDWTSKRIWKHMNGIWFHCTQLFILGIIGTVCGAMYLFYSAFGSITNIAAASFQMLASNMLPPLGIVFSTTALAASAVFILSEQLFILAALSNIEEEV